MTLQTRDMELMLGQRRRRWTTIDPACNLHVYIVIAGIHSLHTSHSPMEHVTVTSVDLTLVNRLRWPSTQPTLA